MSCPAQHCTNCTMCQFLLYRGGEDSGALLEEILVGPISQPQTTNSKYTPTQPHLPAPPECVSVKTGLGCRVSGVVVGAQSELEISQVVGRDVHTDLYPLPRSVLSHDDSCAKPPSTLSLPGYSLIPGISTDSTLTPVLITMSVISATVGLRIIVISRR